MKKPSNMGPSQRQLRVGEQLRHIIAETLQRGDFHHEALINAEGITVTEVRPSPDLKHATAFVMALGGKNMEDILPALKEAAPEFQRDINKQSNMKFTPKIRFKEDESFEQGQKMDALLSNLHYSSQEE
ncbi:MAG: 30S ribosome-binding factor RbfA [Pseudomonadota bacterium]